VPKFSYNLIPWVLLQFHAAAHNLQAQVDLFENLINKALPSVSEETKNGWGIVVTASRYSLELITKRSHKLVN
jgi:hypothetical protein